MRNAFADEILQIARKDKRVVLLSGDIGNRLFDKFKEEFPDRFYNCGVAEANLMSMAAGLASCGLKPIAYTITPFITTRCYEQIRVDVCYNSFPVIIVGVGSGYGYAALGATHHSCEDIAIMRALPTMTVACPSDKHDVRAHLRLAVSHDGPVYIRLGKKNEPEVQSDVPSLVFGKAHELKSGSQVCILSCGTIMPEALSAAQQLEEKGISTSVVNMHTAKPLDTEFLSSLTHELIVCVEEHSLIGGFSSSVAEWAMDTKCDKRIIRMGTRDEFLKLVGNTAYARQEMNIDASSMVKRITEELS